MMDQTCRQVPETFEVSHVDVAVLDERVFDRHIGNGYRDDDRVYCHSKIQILDDKGSNQPRLVIQDMQGGETVACSLDQRVSQVRFSVPCVKVQLYTGF